MQIYFDAKFNAYYHIVLGLAVVGIACATLVTCGALGVGLGILSGLWQTPLAFLASLLAYELPAIGVAALSTSVTFITGLTSGFTFFKEPKVVVAMNHCIEVIKESYLEENSEAVEQEELTHSMN